MRCEKTNVDSLSSFMKILLDASSFLSLSFFYLDSPILLLELKFC